MKIKQMHKRNTLTKGQVLTILLYIYFLLWPFYFFPSGNPQIADFFILLLFLLVYFFSKPVIPDSNRIILFIFVFATLVIYIFIINGIWGITFGDLIFMKNSLFYLYNFIIVATLIGLYGIIEKKLIDIIYRAVNLSLILQFIIFMGTYRPNGFFRETLFFNNPNQLGYYGLLSMCFLVFCYLIDSKRNSKYFFVGIIISYLLILASLSKSSIIGSTILIFLLWIYEIKRSRIKTFVLSSGLLLLIGYLYRILGENIAFFNNVTSQILSIGQTSDDNLAGRGYDRILNHPEYWFFGAGEGVYNRFIGVFDGEIHSTIGSVFFSYGIIGFALFFLLLFVAIYKYKTIHLLPLFAILFYGLTHNGLRNTLFWIFITLMLLNISEYNKSLFLNNGIRDKLPRNE